MAKELDIERWSWEELKEGVVLGFDKPVGVTSFKVVGSTRYKLTHHFGHVSKELKVGHAGTLDPMASGVLVICTGRKTKLIESLQAHTKEYVAGIRLGASTPSHDRETIDSINTEYETAHLSRELIEGVLPRFEGDIEQVPPIFSAVKVNGKRAYELARKGKEVAIEAKRVHVEKIEIVDCALPDLTLRVVCGKGTYIRSLARDLGEALGTGAYLTSLRRTRVGEVWVEDCFTFSV